MRKSMNVAVLSFAALLGGWIRAGNEQPASAQDGRPSAGLFGGQRAHVQTLKPEKLKTLDDIRNLGGWEIDAVIFGVADLVLPPGGDSLKPALDDTGLGTPDADVTISARLSPPDPRKAAADTIKHLRTSLTAPDQDRTQVEAQLKTALDEYFIGDMRHRVRELDELKAKLAQTEAKLQQRLGEREEAVDLQLKIMLREADGTGFFRTEDAANLFESGASRQTDRWNTNASPGGNPIRATPPRRTQF